MKSARVLVKAFNALLGREQNVRGSVNALYNIDILHALVHEGLMFSHDDFHRSVPNDGVIIHVIELDSGSPFHLNEYAATVTGAPAEIAVYESCSYNPSSAGSEITMFNHDRASSNIFHGTVRQNCVLVNTGMELPISHVIPGAKQTGGPGVGHPYEIILDSQKAYAFGFKNTSGAAINADLLLLGCFPPTDR